MRKVSLITLCYNQLESATKPMIESLYKFTNTDLFELIIVNNASSDGTKEYLENLKKEKANITVINNDQNFGFSKGMNQGLKIANGDFIFLLNNDLLFSPNWLEKFIELLEKNEKIGLISCKTNYAGEDFQVIEGAEELTQENYLEKINISQANNIKYIDTSRVVFFCVGMTRKTFETVGYFDENFGLAWFEDDDYTIRTLLAGLKIAIAQDIFIYHNHSKSTSNIAKTKEGKELFEKNRKYFENKHIIFTTLKNIAKKSTDNECEKWHKKYVRYKKYFNIMLPIMIIEAVVILAVLILLGIK